MIYCLRVWLSIYFMLQPLEQRYFTPYNGKGAEIKFAYIVYIPISLANLVLQFLLYFMNASFSSILESCRKRFDLQTDLHLILLPYFLYPLHSMAMTGSILMTVAIALERYNAVHWPISYSQVRFFLIIFFLC